MHDLIYMRKLNFCNLWVDPTACIPWATQLLHVHLNQRFPIKKWKFLVSLLSILWFTKVWWWQFVVCSGFFARKLNRNPGMKLVCGSLPQYKWAVCSVKFHLQLHVQLTLYISYQLHSSLNKPLLQSCMALKNNESLPCTRQTQHLRIPVPLHENTCNCFLPVCHSVMISLST